MDEAELQRVADETAAALANGDTVRALALANVMQDHPGAEDFVKAVERDDRLRRLEKAVLDRDEVQRALVRERPLRRWGWVVAVAVALCVVALMALGGVGGALAGLIFVFLVWRIRNLFDL